MAVISCNVMTFFFRHLISILNCSHLVPMHGVVAHVLGVEPDALAALLTRVGKVLLVAGNATGVLVGDHVALAGQHGLAVPTAEVITMPVLVQSLDVLPRKYELVARPWK